MCYHCYVFFMFIVASTTGEKHSQYGYFWQITDIHYDSNYSIKTSDGLVPCHNKTLGDFGDYNCDSPWKLAESAIMAMKTLKAEADFILWTGDSVAHVPKSTINAAKAFTIVKNVTDELRKAFPTTKIFPTLGNHDSWPANKIPVVPDNYFNSVLTTSGWNNLLSVNSAKTFSTGGYYVEDLGPWRIFGLNTIIWYRHNPLVGNNTDPGGQILWLYKELAEARTLKKKVIFTGHIPPGYFSSVAKTQWFYERFNVELHKAIQEFSDIIIAGIFGHEHRDSFKVVYKKVNNADKPVVPIFMAPAVTPLNVTSGELGPNNPSIRLYKYNNSTGEVYDYTQYFLNLAKANKEEHTDWEIEYSLINSFDINNASASALHNLATQFKETKNPNFQKYVEYNSVSVDTEKPCDTECKVGHICGITCINTVDYNICINQTNLSLVTQNIKPIPIAQVTQDENGTVMQDIKLIPITQVTQDENGTVLDSKHHHHIKPIPIRPSKDIPRYIYYIIGGLVALVVILFLLLAMCCCYRGIVYRRRIPSGYIQINNNINA